MTIKKHVSTFSLYLPPANKVCKGYVFTTVCQSFCSWGEYLGRYPRAGTSPWAGTPPRAGTSPRAGTPPTQCMLGYGQQAGGMHPTGMHSCFSKMLHK